ncbi:MAG: 50S ribosomal protein L9 [Paludibacteraceae bacterium]|nr:50S ribosomal protein L9 [Paludibacteraceae bacterium]MBO7337235.1 50S ribosomal protein L9 [Paludibacteraceae bacterium]MBP5137014.1 50S ribosomal protein L9 [Paludibacteraceae bacterium]MBP5742073.1 50S ribosomal protein L9 [Paludibacteraceae bacterium]
MEVILLEDVHNLGYKDDILKVKDGYGLNYLIPQKKAIVATPSAKKVLAENLKQRAHKLAKIKADAEAEAAKLNGVKVTVAAKASEGGKIFGSITTAQIAEQLEKQGFNIDRKLISLAAAIKELGSYKATVRLHKEVAVEIDLDVVAEA